MSDVSGTTCVLPSAPSRMQNSTASYISALGISGAMRHPVPRAMATHLQMHRYIYFQRRTALGRNEFALCLLGCSRLLRLPHPQVAVLTCRAYSIPHPLVDLHREVVAALSAKSVRARFAKKAYLCVGVRPCPCTAAAPIYSLPSTQGCTPYICQARPGRQMECGQRQSGAAGNA